LGRGILHGYPVRRKIHIALSSFKTDAAWSACTWANNIFSLKVNGRPNALRAASHFRGHFGVHFFDHFNVKSHIGFICFIERILDSNA
jgi:hypothetical protein